MPNESAPSQRLIPLAQAAVARGLNRERLLRLIQSGRVRGVQEHGLWFVIEAEPAISESSPPASVTRPTA